MKKQTKIVATISDLNCDKKFIKKLYQNGMNVVRLNTAHQTKEDSLRVINNVREVNEKIPILLDTKGPEIRTTKGSEEIILKKGDIIQVKGDPDKNSSNKKLYFSYDNIVDDVELEDKILIDDGELELKIIEKNEIDKKLMCEVMNDGTISGRKSVNIPGKHINLPSLTQKDKDYILFAIKNKVEFIAHSFVRNKNDIMGIQKILDKHNSKIKIIAKIENQEGVDNIDEILDHVYGIMVARGDLGIEIAAEKIPLIQKQLIKKCIAQKRPVITATQMLHTMIKNPRPTRAEVSDVANAVLDGTDALMLSGETAYGAYPLEAVKTMAAIAVSTETQIQGFNSSAHNPLKNEIANFLAKSAVQAALTLDVKAIITDTSKGRTARALSSFRGKKPIYAECYDKQVAKELALSFGVYSKYVKQKNNTDKFVKEALTNLTTKKYLKKEDLVVVIAGNFGVSNSASFIEITTVKNCLNK